MGQAKKKRKKDSRHGVPDNVPDDCLVSDNEFVKASQLSQFQIRGCIHLWQVVSGKVKSFTNSFALTLLEKAVDFDWIEFFCTMEDRQKGRRKGLDDGFYWANHYTKQGGFFLCKDWTKETEEILLQIEVITPLS